jgi:hypothetical protein
MRRINKTDIIRTSRRPHMEDKAMDSLIYEYDEITSNML